MNDKDQKPEYPEILFYNHIQAVGKLKYAMGHRPKVDCIFCAIRDDNPNVESLKIYQDNRIMICLNLYPYNPGHLMVIPVRHVEKFEDLTDEERNYLFEKVIAVQKMIFDLLHPTGVNVGYNQGDFSGASIKHIHVHIVPRYKNELGFIDIIGQTKVIIQRSSEIMELFKKHIYNYI